MSPDGYSVEQQLRDLKRLVAYLMVRDGRHRISIPIWSLDQIPDSGQIVTWPDPMSLGLVVELRGVSPVDGIGIMDAEIVEEAATGPRAITARQ